MMKRQSASEIKKLRINAHLNQSQFARQVGVPRSLVSEWEAAKKEPTRETNTLLGNFAEKNDDHASALRFWAKAGTKLRGDGSEAGRSGEVIAVPYTKKIEASSRTPSLRFPSWMIPNPGKTTYVRLSDQLYAPLLQPGDVVLIDESQVDLEKLEGACVAFHRQDEGLEVHLQEAGTGKKLGVQRFPSTARLGVFAAWLVKEGEQIVVKVPSRLGALMTDHVHYVPGIIDENLTVLGRVVAWAPAIRDDPSRIRRGRKR